MTQTEVVTQEQRKLLKQASWAGLAGGVLEWYDFTLYGTAAALVFGHLFFPKISPVAGTLAAFATYAAGFFARPFGGAFFGHLGDKIGRKSILLLTILLMGIATFCIGLLPTYDTIGIGAPILLVLIRLIQGFAGGAEQSGSTILVAEFAPQRERGLFASLPMVGIQFGILLAAGVFGIFSALPRDQFITWGWRIPFLLSAVVVWVGLYLRLHLKETPAFTEARKENKKTRAPLAQVFRSSWKEFLFASGVRIAENGSSYIFQTFVLSFIVGLGVPNYVGLIGVQAAAALAIITLPLVGRLSDRIGRRPIFIATSIFLIVLAFPYFWLLGSKSPFLIVVAVMLSYGIGTSSLLAAELPFCCELFPTEVRYSGMALSREFSAPIAGGIAPFVATALLAWSGGQTWPISIYIIVLAVFALVASLLSPETYKRDLRHIQAGKEEQEEHVAALQTAEVELN